MKEILVRPEGIYLAKLEQLTVDDIKKLKQKVRNRLIKLHDSIKEINELETMLKALNSDEVKRWISEADRKANAFLKTFLGEDLYNELQQKGEITFTQKNTKYRVTKRGEIYRGRSRKPLCLIKPSDIPLPDYIASALITLKEKRYTAVRR